MQPGIMQSTQIKVVGASQSISIALVRIDFIVTD